jgi:Fe-S cluster biogenesis protein NfuA
MIPSLRGQKAVIRVVAAVLAAPRNSGLQLTGVMLRPSRPLLALRRLPHTAAGWPAAGLHMAAVGCSRRFLTVELSDTPNPESKRFFSMELEFMPPGQTLDMPNSGHGYKSPLGEALFAIDGVAAVYFATDYITVTKEAAAGWDAVGPLVTEAIIAFAESKVDILSAQGQEEMRPNNEDTEPHPDDDEVVLAVKELLGTRIRPMLQGDGGNVRYVGMDDGTVYVMLEGACRTCPSSGATLKNGIERMLMHWVPEVLEVLEVDKDFADDYTRSMQGKKAGAA